MTMKSYSFTLGITIDSANGKGQILAVTGTKEKFQLGGPLKTVTKENFLKQLEDSLDKKSTDKAKDFLTVATITREAPSKKLGIFTSIDEACTALDTHLQQSGRSDQPKEFKEGPTVEWFYITKVDEQKLSQVLDNAVAEEKKYAESLTAMIIAKRATNLEQIISALSQLKAKDLKGGKGDEIIFTDPAKYLAANNKLLIVNTLFQQLKSYNRALIAGNVNAILDHERQIFEALIEIKNKYQGKMGIYSQQHKDLFALTLWYVSPSFIEFRPEKFEGPFKPVVDELAKLKLPQIQYDLLAAEPLVQTNERSDLPIVVEVYAENGTATDVLGTSYTPLKDDEKAPQRASSSVHEKVNDGVTHSQSADVSTQAARKSTLPLPSFSPKTTQNAASNGEQKEFNPRHSSIARTLGRNFPPIPQENKSGRNERLQTVTLDPGKEGNEKLLPNGAHDDDSTNKKGCCTPMPKCNVM